MAEKHERLLNNIRNMAKYISDSLLFQQAKGKHMKIFLAAGHGGTDPGAIGGQTEEKLEAIKIVDEVERLLRPVLGPQQELIIVPHEFKLEETVKYINENAKEAPEDICIEVHLNSNEGVPGSGTETYYGEQQLAVKLQTEIVRVLGLRDRGVRWGMHLYFNKATNPPSALVELGFINNPEDLDKVRQKGAFALARAIGVYLNANVLAEPQPQPEKPGVDYKILYETLRESVKDVIKATEQLKQKLG